MRIYRARMPHAMVSAPGSALLTTKGINFPLTRFVFGCKDRQKEGMALMSISNISILLVVKKYTLPVRIHTSARIIVSSVFMI